jgi:hypothetical protein
MDPEPRGAERKRAALSSTAERRQPMSAAEQLKKKLRGSMATGLAIKTLGR